MKLVQLLGGHLLADQMAATFSHEGVTVRRYDDLASLLREGLRSAPVIVWTTDNRFGAVAAVRLRLAGFEAFRYWIGGDVLRITRLRGWRRALLTAANRRFYRGHASNSAWLTTELAEAGLNAVALPFSPACCAEHWQLAPDPVGPYQVIFYSLPGNDAIYRPDIMLAAAAALPMVRFVAVGDPGFRSDLPNVDVRGTIPTSEFRKLYHEAHALLRLTTHDGFPRMVLEAMSSGLDVLFSHEIPNTHLVASVPDVVAALTRLEAAPRARNVAAREWALANHSAASWREAWGAMAPSLRSG